MEKRKAGNAAFYAAMAVCLLAVGVGSYQLLRRGGEKTVQTPPQMTAVAALPAEENPPVAAMSPEPIENRPAEEEMGEPVSADPEPAVSASSPAPVSSAPAAQTVSAPAAEPAGGPEEPDVTEPAMAVETPLEGETVAAFSMDALAYNATLSDWRTHDGVDIAAELGTAVLAACDGTVSAITDDPLMGTTLVLSHDGGYETTYASLQNTGGLETGDHVSAGELVGTVGDTAAAEAHQGPHLHFSVRRDGEIIDPEAFLAGEA